LSAPFLLSDGGRCSSGRIAGTAARPAQRRRLRTMTVTEHFFEEPRPKVSSPYTEFSLIDRGA
jgi:hypothetical protein